MGGSGRWIGTGEAARLLGWSQDYLRRYARKGGLAWRAHASGRGVKVRLAAVEALARERAAARAAHREWRPKHRRPGEAAESELPLISCREAAELLGVSVGSAARLGRRGHLIPYQEKEGVQGSRLWFARAEVENLAARDSYLERRDRRAEGIPGGQAVRWEAHGIGPVVLSEPSAATERDHGAFYTTRQAALALGVSPTAVRRLRESGRLTGHRSPGRRKMKWKVWHQVPDDRVGIRWWFYRKAEVHALLSDPAYRRKRGLA